MSNLPIRQLRLRPFANSDLLAITGNQGDIYFDANNGTLRVFNGTAGGQGLLKDDLSNIKTTALNKSVNFGSGTVTASQFIGAGIGAIIGDTAPVAPTAQTGTLWFNTTTGQLFVYYNDGTSVQWVQPMTPSYGGGGGGGGGSGTVNFGVAGKLAYYPSNSSTVDDLSELSWASNTLTVAGAVNVSAQKNFIRFHWDTLTDLNNEAPPDTWHGMMAHVHATGRAYVAHAGVWQPLALQSDLSAGITNILAGDNITVTNNSGVFTINAVVGGGGGGITLEESQDGAATLFQNGSHTGITFSYSDATNALNAVVTDIPLGTRTTGNYVASVATASGITGGAAGSEGAVISLGIDTTVVATLASAQTLTNKTISGATNTLTNIANAALTNSSITINGQSVSLGGTINVSSGSSTLDGLTDVVITSPSNGQVLKYDGSNWVNNVDATGGGGSNTFSSIAVAGQPTVTADSLTDTLTLVAGTNTSITTDATTDSITINNTLSLQNAFSIIAVAGQSNVEADTTSDTLTLAAGTGISITTTAGTDTVTITSTVSAGASTFNSLSDVGIASLTLDKIYLPAITMLSVTANGSSSYSFDQYSSTNPTIYAINGTTIAFNLNISGHPFLIRTSGGSNYNTGLVHVSTAGVVSTGASAQGQVSGTLYWKIPNSINGNYQYICSIHTSMVGVIAIKDFAAI